MLNLLKFSTFKHVLQSNNFRRKLNINFRCISTSDYCLADDADDSKKLKICEKPEKKPVCIPPPCDAVCKKKERVKVKPKEVPIEDITIGPLEQTVFDDSKIVIIGAGLAGLSAAKYFEEHNVPNYVVLEALERPGGRIQSEWFGDSVVELGAMRSKPASDCVSFLQSAVADELLKPPIGYFSIFKTNDGHTISNTVNIMAYDIYKRIYSESLSLEADTLDFMNFRIAQEVNYFPPKIRQDAARIMLGLLALQHRKEGDNLSQFISKRNGVTFLSSPGGNLQVPLGYFGIIQPILNTVPAEKMKFRKPVQTIQWGAVVCKDTPRALVKCSDGSVYPADYVLVTVSLGVLKQSHNCLFCPALPAKSVQAIEKMGFLHINHFYILFCSPFWSWTKQTIDFNFSKTGTRDLCGWLRGLRRVQQVPGSSNVLFVSVVGEEAKMAEKLTGEAMIDGITDVLLQSDLKVNFPKIQSFLKSRWSNNVYFNGAYSYLPIGIPDGFQQELASPLPGNNAPVNPNLFFAGEATCPKLSGTVQAAKISGIREAARIKKIIVNSSPKEKANQKLEAIC